jgi:hypothetical protein
LTNCLCLSQSQCTVSFCSVVSVAQHMQHSLSPHVDWKVSFCLCCVYLLVMFVSAQYVQLSFIMYICAVVSFVLCSEHVSVVCSCCICSRWSSLLLSLSWKISLWYSLRWLILYLWNLTLHLKVNADFFVSVAQHICSVSFVAQHMQ